jgi:hypothetical protein
MTTYKLQKEGDRYFTEPILTEEEWLAVIQALDVPQRRRQLDVLRMFLTQPGNKATCSQIGKEYSMSDSAVNMLVQHLGKFAQKFSGKDFRIESDNSSDDSYWPITMTGRQLRGGRFEWNLRPELIAALRRFLISKLLAAYRGPVLSEGLDNSRSDELYKWKLISSVQGQSTEIIVRKLVTKECNFLERAHVGATLVSLLDSAPEKVFGVFDLLRQEKSLDVRVQEFISAAQDITPKGLSSFGNERTAAAFLACCDPQTYTPYTSTIYEAYCKYLGIPTKYTGQKYPHFLDLLKAITPLEEADSELQNKLHQETAPYFWSSLLNAQDVLWQMSEYMKNSHPKNWLQRIYDEAIRSKHWVYERWYPEYKKSVERFLGMFSEGMTAEDVDEETKDYFIRAYENGISSNLQGKYSNSEYEKILPLWPQMYEIFQRNIADGSISREDYDAMRQLMQSALTKNHPAAFHRLWAALFPQLLTTTITDSKFKDLYERVRSVDQSLPESTGHWLEDNMALMAYFKEKVAFKEPLHQGLLAWYLYENLNLNENNDNMDKYTTLLLANHNLVLTGAPGTGKTYLAKKIAEALGDDNPGFVQFHPSYDYTDFVEGLRPTDDSTFERVNGVFKQFCADALTSVDASSFDAAYEKLIQDLSAYTEPRIIKSGIVDSASFGIMVNSKGNLDLYTSPRELETDMPTMNPDAPEYKKNGTLTKERILDCDNQIYWKGYYVGVKNLLKKEYGYVEGKVAGPKNRVFIIDEINRGELSKIFGELFFAIEPNYRGEKGRVKTQYQNMVEPGDPFYKGFFVPENVYVIGTMNDIDRGVESMDFAIRRRFAWVEVKAEDRIAMLEAKVPQWSDAAKRCMSALNAALKDKHIGLTSAYDIGPAYFLKLEQYDGDFEQLWEYHILGILTEYLRGTRGIEEKLAMLKEAFDQYKEA